MMLVFLLTMFGGLMFVGAAVIMFFGLATIPYEEEGIPQALEVFLRYGVPALFLLPGMAFLIPGVRGLLSIPYMLRIARELRERGILTNAEVTYVDRNFRVQVNGQPIYSIVEYQYQDGLGQTYTRRVDHVKSEIVIRNKVEVGSTIPIYYHPDDPGESRWDVSKMEYTGK